MEKHSVQRIVSQNLTSLLETSNFPLYQLKALESLATCRTAALGGHSQYCEKGHLNGVWYNSCKYRACPQCQNMANEEWQKNTQSLLLDCAHHHIVFTMPSELNVLWRFNRTLMADLLFQAVKNTLKTFAKDKRYLGAAPGILSALHAWGRDLSLHPHLHVLVSHGGLNDQGEWVEPKKKHLFPQKPVMMVFRGKLLALLKRKLEDEALELPSHLKRLRLTRVCLMTSFVVC